MVALLLAAAVALGISLVGTGFAIEWLRARGIGQFIREEGPSSHVTKAGTPTMGGVMIVVAAVAGYAVAHVRSGVVFTRSGLLVLAAIIGASVVGAVDDWLGIKRARNLGLNKRAKILGLLAVGVAFVVLAVYHTPVHTELSFTRLDSIGLDLGKLGWALLGVLLILAASNAVNLADGLDGLAAGSANYSFIAYTVIGFWGFRHPEVYQLPHALDVAVVAAAMLGACTGFLWWNAAPSRIMMGDTGALAIGAGLAGLALMTDTHLLLPIVGGLFVMETMSVIVQVGSFRLFGRRVFRMAPIHHHFELLGWPETTVIIRFWILAGLCTALALGLYYADFLTTGVPD
ncbi:MAG: phospho-N-acetylmuramoyl-pentapeptide-transferase [Acidimicrobiales bacterium]